MRNLLTRVPKSAAGLVASLVRSIFEQPNADAVWKQHSDVVEKLDESADNGMAVHHQAGMQLRLHLVAAVCPALA